jgi:hypothetical protein
MNRQANGHFAKGNPGRPKGAKNTVTTRARNHINKTVMGYLKSEDFTEDLASLKPKERIEVYFKMLEFILPKPKEQPEVEVNIEQPPTFQFVTEKTYLHPDKWRDHFKKETPTEQSQPGGTG